ncbi:MRN complex-interacting protein isoform X1 [Astatotilapia calliptera]|uniref:MRN complex-interacting protein isoform X1 n=1 Tax=Astatotilapia calliptera TaxID=8154 RepID=UPI000E41C98A|nr:MRN complex-interacting protein isoform X1 [Astatotilapia calliptera]
MGQEFHIVRCFRCQSFQVQQVKKARKWSCKLCGEKQSLLKEFGRGNAADCRRHVQKLNAMRGAMMEEQERRSWSLWEQEQQEEQQEDEEQTDEPVSRWSKYLDTPEEVEQDDEAEPEKDLGNRRQLHGIKMTDRKRKRAEEAGPEDVHTSEQLNCMKLQTPSTINTCSPTLFTTRWANFLSPDSKVQEGEKPAVGEWSQSLSGVAAPSCSGIISRPRPLLPVTSMFDSGEDFNFDDDFLVKRLPE